jgi:hypothetical protein
MTGGYGSGTGGAGTGGASNGTGGSGGGAGSCNVSAGCGACLSTSCQGYSACLNDATCCCWAVCISGGGNPQLCYSQCGGGLGDCAYNCTNSCMSNTGSCTAQPSSDTLCKTYSGTPHYYSCTFPADPGVTCVVVYPGNFTSTYCCP